MSCNKRQGRPLTFRKELGGQQKQFGKSYVQGPTFLDLR